jgi:hypothetical protein
MLNIAMLSVALLLKLLIKYKHSSLLSRSVGDEEEKRFIPTFLEDCERPDGHRDRGRVEHGHGQHRLAHPQGNVTHPLLQPSLYG